MRAAVIYLDGSQEPNSADGKAEGERLPESVFVFSP